MANSSRYNDHYRDLDLIEGAPRPARTFGCLLRIAEAVRRQERDTLIALGVDAMDASFSSWEAFQGVIDISVKPHPQFYCDTTGKMIIGKSVS